jgi:hypothetical protein
MVGWRPENSAEPGPERPATQWQERETKAKRIRLEMVGWRPENSAEPGPERPATQWQERETMASLLSRRPVTYRCGLVRGL